MLSAHNVEENVCRVCVASHQEPFVTVLSVRRNFREV